MQIAASPAAEESNQSRPSISKSFSRYEPDHPDPLPKAKTFHAGTNTHLNDGQARSLLSEALSKNQNGDVFESRDAEDEESPLEHVDGTLVKLPQTLEELPIEIRSLTERFLDSLSAKVHPTPLSVDALSELFQAFYTRADAAISTHIAALSSRISREASPARKDVASSQDTSKGRGRSNSGAKQNTAEFGEQQMLTPTEINNRRKARRVLELKRTALEEAVERWVCQQLYDRLWRHRSTDDEERDSKLRSKAAALAVVGIGLRELHIDTDESKDEARQVAGDKKEEIDESLATAREHILKMNEERYPLGKLKHLTAAHKSIVETLSQLFPSSSSADEVLPTLIYTLITTPAESINAVSNVHFIQRFRAVNKMDGEASYCLVNLEAAISFLETVDLSSLRADEVPEGPPKSSRSQSFASPVDKSLSTLSISNTANTAKLDASPLSSISATAPARPDISPTPSSSSRASNPRERLNSLIKKADTNIEAGRESFLSSADSALDTINATLNDSFKFFFGRLKEQQQHERDIQKQHATIRHDSDNPSPATNSRSPTVIPETLEDARKIVNPPAAPAEDDTTNEINRETPSSTPDATLERETALFNDPLHANGSAAPPATKSADSKLLDLLAGRSRDRSADSTRSTSTAASTDPARKRVLFTSSSSTSSPPSSSVVPPASTATTIAAPAPPSTAAVPVSASPPTATAAIESVRSLGTSLNPLNRLGGIGFRGFGRQSAPAAAAPTSSPAAPASPGVEGPGADGLALAGSSSAEANPSVNGLSGAGAGGGGDDKVATAVVTELKRLLPAPRRRFVEMRDAREMKVGEVEELLREYQRLVAGVQKVVSST
ncbi:MAG: hypothetical protein M1821_009484 [Bathelium mastoideum]|nr:MAG: hypothetical protein M1821_009484 [Bathelium mastoideum]